MRHIVIFPTFRCGLRCGYCKWVSDGNSTVYLGSNCFYKVDRESTSNELIRILNRFHPSTFEFSGGGEPLKFKGITKVLNSLPSWSMTSNTLHSLSGIDFSKCFHWSASFHYHISARAKDKFISNIDFLKKMGVNTSVTLVAIPETVDTVLEWTKYFKGCGFNISIHPYYDDPNFSWYRHLNELNKLRDSFHVVYGDKLFEYKGLAGKNGCGAGKDYFIVAPDGKVFRCLTGMIFGWGIPMDEISSESYDCNYRCMFPCDFRFARKEEE